MTNIIETTIVLGTTGLIVALFANAYNKALSVTHKREIELLNKEREREINGHKNQCNKLQTDINTLVSDLYTDDEKRLVRNHYLNKISMKESLMNMYNTIKRNENP